MTSEIEDKLHAYGDVSLKIIRVSDGGIKNSVFGTIMLIIRHYQDGDNDYIQIKISPMTAAAAMANASAVDKLSINKLDATVDHKDKMIILGPPHGIHIEENLQNKGIGGFALNELLTILRRMAPNYNIAPFEITMSEDMPQAYKEKVVAFFGKFNINFSFTDTEQRVGIMRASPPSNLVSYYNQSKIKELDVEQFIFQLVADRTKNEGEIIHLKKEVERMGDETFAGIPKKQLVRYTLICCGLALIFVLLLIM